MIKECKLNKHIVDELNEELQNMGCIFQFKYDEDSMMPSMCIEPINKTFINSTIINLNDDAYDFIDNFMSARDITLNWNNTGSIAW